MRIFRFTGFILFYVWEVILGSIRVAVDALTWKHYMKPAFLRLELDERLKPHQILALSNLLTMTPGTISMDVADDLKSIDLHIMYLDGSVEDFKQGVLKAFEQRVLRSL